MSRWFRHYAGMARDDKLVRAALRSKQPVERVVWVWCAVLESAAERDAGGTFEFDVAEAAYFLHADEADIARIISALEDTGRIGGGVVSAWDRRQFKADSSAERVKRHRDKRIAAGLPGQWAPTPELRQEIYARDGHACVYCASTSDLTIDHKTPPDRGGDNDRANLQTACRGCNARKRDLTDEEYRSRLVTVTPVTVTVTPQRTESQEEAGKTPSEPKSPSPASDRKKLSIETKFDTWWALYPNKVGKGAARRKFFEVAKAKPDGVTYEQIMAGLQRYVAKTDDRPWCQPLTWLSQGRWSDEPNDGKQPGGRIVVTTKAAEQRQISEAEWRLMLEKWLKTPNWSRAAGPAPNDPATWAPPTLLAEYGIEPGKAHPAVRRQAELQEAMRAEVQARVS